MHVSLAAILLTGLRRQQTMTLHMCTSAAQRLASAAWQLCRKAHDQGTVP